MPFAKQDLIIPLKVKPAKILYLTLDLLYISMSVAEFTRYPQPLNKLWNNLPGSEEATLSNIFKLAQTEKREQVKV